MSLELPSPCKVNLLLNILGKRADGFHELETVMHPVGIFDRLSFERGGSGLRLTCSEPSLPTDSRNLVHRAAEQFISIAGIREGVSIHLEKKIPMAAGLGGGSGNAATALLGLQQVYGNPLSPRQVEALAASLGSDVPFFLQHQPAIGTGRGESIRPLGKFQAMNGASFLLVHPGFGISTPWAYQNLARFPEALNGRPGRALQLIELLCGTDLSRAAKEFYNSLEAPAFEKYPLLALFCEFFLETGAAGALMSGSGSTTFAVVENRAKAEALAEKFRGKFGESGWMAVVNV